jgi:N-acetylmuramoyl-L-alanine amidase
MMSQKSSRITVLFFVVALYGLCSAAVTMKVADNQPIPSFERNSVTYISLTKFCETAGWSWTWDIVAQKLTCTWQKHTIVFSQDIPFYTIDDSVMQLPVPPMRHYESLYLPAKLIPPIFNDLLKDPVEWLQNEKQFISANLSAAVPKSATMEAVAATPAFKTDSAAPKPATVTAATPATFTDSLSAVKEIPVDTVHTAKVAPVDTPAQTDKPDEIDTVPPTYHKSEWEDLSTVHNKSSSAPMQSDAQTTNSSAVPIIKTIVIDPGHGGKDPGAIGPSGIQEKDIVLAIGLKLYTQLKKHPELQVYMTRSNDTFIPLVGRTRFANEKKADVFISIHANSIRGTMKKKEEAKGYKIYFLSQAKNEEDKVAAMQENEVIRLEDRSQHKYDNLENILIDMAGNEYLRESQDLSIMMDRVFSQSLTTIGKLHRGIGQANFWVLNGAYMPSLLVETGFISNPDEEMTLRSESFQDSMAAALCEAVLKFKQKIETAR